MAIKVGINGFGRIGRMVLRSIIENNRKDIQVVHINNKSSPEVSSFLLANDTVHGKLKLNTDLSWTSSDDGKIGGINFNKKVITMTRETEISKVDWKHCGHTGSGADVVLECTGKFNTIEKSSGHINAGANKVIVSAPCKGAKNIIFGVNEKDLKSKDKVISAASCTTNCLAPVAHVLNEEFGIERGFMTTIHSYTTDQRLLDNSHKDLRRARSAPNSMVPTTTGATKSLGDVIPSLKDKVEGISIRVPTPNVSLIEFVFSSPKNLTVEKINNSFIKASKSNLKNILAISNEPLVSSDFNHNSNSAIVDVALTKVIDNKMAKVSAWYDNEWGFACRMCDLANYLGKI